ncbi:MAG: hypothetical protein EA412_01210 [Chitinophagaceae bacterium]|nr:MAG: hypothetical protein EA412_01210 [Chitinophagaceae bacterium]
MKDIDLRYQTVLFGNFEDIGPKPETLKYFIDKFSDKELIPTTFQELTPQGPINRFSLITSDEVWLLEFSSNRLDIQKTNKNVGLTKMGTLEQFIIDIKRMIKIIDEKFPRKFNRLSLVTRYLLKPMVDKEFSVIYNKLNNSIDIYKNNEIADWKNRTVSRIPYQVDKSEELFNVISEIKRTKGTLSINSKVEKIDRVELHFDINTYQGNTDFRFDCNLFDSFIDVAYKLESELKTKYLKFIES